MNQVSFRFYAELNDFLPERRRMVAFTHAFEGKPSIKDMIEGLGVPHTEIDLILANGISVDFSCLGRDGDYISVYPVFESLDISPLLCVRPYPLRETRFILDTHLGNLATYLRMLGFDTLYQNDCRDERLAHVSSQERRILLTRDRGLLKRRIVTHGYCVREVIALRQVVEILRRFDLFTSVTPFQRCLRCNRELAPIEKALIDHRLPPKVRQCHDEYRICRSCDRVYWKGSHHERMQEMIAEIQAQDSEPNSKIPLSRQRRGLRGGRDFGKTH